MYLVTHELKKLCSSSMILSWLRFTLLAFLLSPWLAPIEIQDQPWRCAESCPPSSHAAWALAPPPASLQTPCKDSLAAPYCIKRSPKLGGVEKRLHLAMLTMLGKPDATYKRLQGVKCEKCWWSQSKQRCITELSINLPCNASNCCCDLHSLSSKSQTMSNHPSAPCSNDPNLDFP